jgi:SAM-dependent methyltransferase
MNVHRFFERIYWALEHRIAPGAESSQNVYARIVKAHLTPSTRWLDLGCGHQLWGDWIPVSDEVRRVAFLVGIDPDVQSLEANDVVRHRVAGLKLPFRDGSFDLITANMVFEHLEDPMAVLRDIGRALAPGGLCIFHTPNVKYWQFVLAKRFPQFLKDAFVQFSEGRPSKDVYPTFYRINTEASAKELAESAGFRVSRITMLNSSSTASIFLLGPFVLLELLWIRFIRRPQLRDLRTNIIAEIRTSRGTERAATPGEESVSET